MMRRFLITLGLSALSGAITGALMALLLQGLKATVTAP